MIDYLPHLITIIQIDLMYKSVPFFVYLSLNLRVKIIKYSCLLCGVPMEMLR